jgi:hypothetical protein
MDTTSAPTAPKDSCADALDVAPFCGAFWSGQRRSHAVLLRSLTADMVFNAASFLASDMRPVLADSMHLVRADTRLRILRLMTVSESSDRTEFNFSLVSFAHTGFV